MPPAKGTLIVTALRATKLTRIAATTATATGAAAIALTTLGTGTAHAATDTGEQHKPLTVQAGPAEAVQKQADQIAQDAKKDKSDDAKSAGKAKSGKDAQLDGWIREAMSIMDKHDIPGSYDGIKRNIIRESAGDPNAVNDWDVNAQKGTPSRGLLQVIQPTFDQYHVKGTPDKLTDPVANIVAACNYAADRYGSMDNVDSAY
ncbi:transglycosylase SLT domain-containing protein [Streptomyces cacaoi]|uniref:transglycosylase SLT domain-containing protein n=1 Tax=Streptomyces cacaoi TaxID=1898 RepID=UPI000A3CF1DD|nr:transglycosylase SLT domain-containing protein [Streptomyces cacaoi]NNG86978.1 transglycosylase SLT domain-containing protein [Streptomyces cacaoi]